MKPKFQKHIISDTIKINSVVTVHYNEFSGNYIFPGEKHNFWEFVYVDKGTAIALAGEKELYLSHGEIIFHKPNEFHAIKADKNDPPNVVVVTFTTNSQAMNFFEGTVFSLPKESRYHIKEILENARRTFVMPIKNSITLLDSPILGGDQMIKTHTEQLLIELMRHYSKNEFSTSRETIENKTIGGCINYLEKNIYGNISIDEVCDAVNYSRTYVCTLFKSVTGKTIIEYYNCLKIDEAKKLIRKKEYTFSQISDMLGFNSPNYFSHIFSKISNMSPSEYRDSLM